MAENNKNIDELVKDLMQGFKPEAPSKNVWEKIKRKLFLYNISRRVWFWVFVSSVFVVSFFVFAGSFGDGNPDNIKARYDLRKEVFSLHNAQQNPAQVDDKKKVKKYNENKIASTEEKQSDNLINDHSQRKNNTYINNDGNVISANTNETESNSSNNTVPGNENKDGLVLSGIYNADKENNNHSSDKNKANNIYNDEESKLAWQLLQKKAESENLLKNNNQSYTDQTDFKNINASNLTTSL
ncbi:MAG: hypothetical protein K9H84_08510, partial [Bacteroidales bacterium]|nr:hypothetical protein [Bacteroidales bacterium]